MLFGDFHAQEPGRLIQCLPLGRLQLAQRPQAEQPRVDVTHRALDEEQRRQPGGRQLDLERGWMSRQCLGGNAKLLVVDVAHGAREATPHPVGHKQRKVVIAAQHLQDTLGPSAPGERRRKRVASAHQPDEGVLPCLALDPRRSLGDRRERHDDGQLCQRQLGRHACVDEFRWDRGCLLGQPEDQARGAGADQRGDERFGPDGGVATARW